MELDSLELGRLCYFAQLLPHARDERELRAFVTECRVALLALEPHASPEPMPLHISRDLFPAQGADAEAVCDRILTASGESLREQQAPGVAWEIDGDVPRLVPLRQATEDAAKQGYPCAGCGKLLSRSEGGAIFTVCDECWVKRWPDGAEAEDAAERVLQAGERRRAAAEEPPIEAGAGFAPGELARSNWSGVVGCEE
jgi:hypothetical protein